MRKSQDLYVPALISSSHPTEMLVDAVLQSTGIPASARITLREVVKEDWAEKSGSENELYDSEKNTNKNLGTPGLLNNYSTIFCKKETNLIWSGSTQQKHKRAVSGFTRFQCQCYVLRWTQNSYELALLCVLEQRCAERTDVGMGKPLNPQAYMICLAQ